MKYYFLLLFACCLSFGVEAQTYTRQDTLRGTITAERSWWDLTHYHLSVEVDPEKKFLSGTNKMKYIVLSKAKAMQIELQAPMVLDKVVQAGKELAVAKDGYSYFITLSGEQKIGQEYELTMHFSGNPKVAVRPPWDGGITWQKDENGNDFIASSCQGLGASIWWPNKDHAYDEPNNGMLISVEVPQHLMDVSNGRLVKVDKNKKKKTKTYHWEVKNPINNYGVNINIGDYVHFKDVFEGENGKLDMDYYVLSYNLDKAKKQFLDAPKTMKAFEHWFGPYPFYEDSYKLVEAPYLGMEHQSSVTYGNGYQNGYRGYDLSSTGWGLKFDFIIVHESGHEWFANNITQIDVADMWIHESFTNYSESLFVEYYFGKEAGFEYVRGTRKNIANDIPIIGVYNVHQEGSSDMYYKGGNMLHTIRQIVDSDEKWRMILRGLNKTFYHQTVSTADIENYISQQAGKDLSKVFDQYLRDVRIPILEYFVKAGKMEVRWSNCVEGFNMPIKITINGKEQWIEPTAEWSEVSISNENPEIKVNSNFYVGIIDVLGN